MNLGYNGKPYDTATGLYNYGYRDYKPEAARFTTIDPVRDGANWFAYVNNDPVNWVDPWGLSASDKNKTELTNDGKIRIVNSDNKQLGVLTVTSFKPMMTEYRSGGFSVGADITIYYEDNNSGYTNFNFVQTVRVTEKNQPLSTFNDAADDYAPFYNTPKETKYYQEHGITNGAVLTDTPSRTNPTSPIEWEAETSLVGKNIQGDYEIMATVNWGFRYNSDTVTAIPPTLQSTPSEFQQNLVNGLNQ
jgi:RHS repeat-associated protein